MALISIIEKTIVEKKKFMKSEDILNVISLASLLLGPVAVNIKESIPRRVKNEYLLKVK